MTEHPIRPFDSDDAVRHVGEAMIACMLPPEAWTHEAHIATCAWLILERPDVVPERDLPNLIRRFNVSVGGVNNETQGYHETITQTFIAGVRACLARQEHAALSVRVNVLLEAPEGGRGWPLLFYSRERLFSVAARLGFVEPDLAPLPRSGAASIPRPARSGPRPFSRRKHDMANLSQVKEHMEIVGADGVHVGRVDKVEGDRIKMIKADSGSHSGHHHYISGGLVAAVEGGKVRLSANGDNAVLLEEESGGEGIADRGGGMMKKMLVGAAAVLGIAALGRMIFKRRKNRSGRDSSDSSGA